MNNLTLGSLFAGIGGFELAARETGITTLWNCEFEPYPRLVLNARFPASAQYGDISKLNGADVAPVDIVTFGSPCQSFSIAGGRAGLEGASGLFYQAVRVIREMRQATNNQYPRFAVMENVPGIYSSKSNEKSDFGVVLNEFVNLCGETVVVPEPKNAKFLNAGSIVGDGYSLAWRTLCASKFGVAQRRRRMFLVIDFTGGRAAEILSERQGENRNFTPSYFKGENAAGSAAEGSGGVATGTAVAFEPGALKRIDKSVWEEQARTLRADAGDNSPAVAYQTYPLDLRNAARSGGNQGAGIGDEGEPAYTVTAEYTHGVAVASHIIANHAEDSRYTECTDGIAPTMNARMGSGGGNVGLCVEVGLPDGHRPVVMDERKQAAPVTEDYVGALTATDYKGSAVYFEPKTMRIREGKAGGGKGHLLQNDKSATLASGNDQTLFEPKTYGICSMSSNSMKSDNPDSGVYEAETSKTLDGNAGNPSANQGGTVIAIQGNVIGRKDTNGPAGIGFRDSVGYSLTAVDKQAVCYQEIVSPLTTELAHQTGVHGQSGGQLIVEKEPACYQDNVGALCASDYKGIRNQDIGDDKAVVETREQTFCFGNNGYGKWNGEPAALKANGGDFPGGENVVVENKYAVRRLTPLECVRLQGYPDWWLDDLHIAEPSDEDITYWYGVWEEHRAALGKSSKAKSRKQIEKWLKNPYSDGNAYKAIGNSLAVPCALFVLRGIVDVTQ